MEDSQQVILIIKDYLEKKPEAQAIKAQINGIILS